MAKYLPYGGVTFPPQGSGEIQERVKHFESDVSFENLQIQMNIWLLFISSQAVLNRPAVRNISFSHYIKPSNPNKNTIIYLAQVHYILIGDADESL